MRESKARGRVCVVLSLEARPTDEEACMSVGFVVEVVGYTRVLVALERKAS